MESQHRAASNWSNNQDWPAENGHGHSIYRSNVCGAGRQTISDNCDILANFVAVHEATAATEAEDGWDGTDKGPSNA